MHLSIGSTADIIEVLVLLRNLNFKCIKKIPNTILLYSINTVKILLIMFWRNISNISCCPFCLF